MRTVITASYTSSQSVLPSVTDAETTIDTDDDNDGYSDVDEGDVRYRNNRTL